MTISPRTAGDPPIVTRNGAAVAIRDALNHFIGTGRPYTRKEVAEATGVPYRVIETAQTPPGSVEGRPMPMYALLSLSAFLGADFTNRWLAVAKQGAFDFPDVAELRPAVEVAEAATWTSQLSLRAIDQELCSKDLEALLPYAVDTIEAGMRIVAMAGIAA